jgi:two-component system chemotaxis response regulator CheY
MFPTDIRILIVDDMSVMRRLVGSILANMGFKTVVEAVDGGDAWVKFQKAEQEGAPFQLVISDWNMPRMKGIDLLRRIRQNPTLGKMPFILLTAENDAASVEEAAAAGVTCHLPKPFNEVNLRDSLVQAFEKTRAQAG